MGSVDWVFARVARLVRAARAAGSTVAQRLRPAEQLLSGGSSTALRSHLENRREDEKASAGTRAVFLDRVVNLQFKK